MVLESTDSTSLRDGAAYHLSWFALRTKSNFERVSATSLEQKGYATFLPIYRCRRQRWDRVVELDLPLFPSYVFCQFEYQHRLPVLMSPGIVHIVGSKAAPEPISGPELAAIRAIVDSQLRAEPWPFLRVGQRVRLAVGPLAGLEGFLVAFKGEQRLVVSVTLLQRSVATEIDATWARPVF